MLGSYARDFVRMLCEGRMLHEGMRLRKGRMLCEGMIKNATRGDAAGLIAYKTFL